MSIEVLGCAGGQSLDTRLTCLLVEGETALDAGSLAQSLPVERQVGVKRILLTHSHTDHTNSIPFFVENVYGRAEEALDIYASGPTIYALRRHLFNNATWPDFTRIPNHLLPAVRFHELENEVPVTFDGVTFTPIAVDHLVPTFGFLIEKNGSSVLWSSDTGPTQRLWEVANEMPNLRGVWVETSFDNALQNVADLSGHLTPATLRDELTKLHRDVPVLLHHLKPTCSERIRREVAELGDDRIGYLEQGGVYDL